MTQTSPELLVSKVRHEIRQRTLQVKRIEQLTPAMRRIVVGGEQLDGFYSPSFDDHVKLFIPSAPGEKPLFPQVGPDGKRLPDVPVSVMRDYTPRHYNPESQELTLDFVLHEGGVATDWARHAKVGDYLGTGGPRGSFIIPHEFDWHCLIGDETALPAIARRLAELPADKPVLAIIETRQAAARLNFQTCTNLDLRWVLAEPGADGKALEKAVQQLSLPTGEGFVWAAGEYTAIKNIREHCVGALGLDKSRIRASSYWRRGVDDAHETF